MTGTFKLKKKDLQEEGYDPRKVNDKLYYFDPKSGYQSLTPEIYDQIQAGKIRFWVFYDRKKFCTIGTGKFTQILVSSSTRFRNKLYSFGQ